MTSQIHARFPPSQAVLPLALILLGAQVPAQSPPQAVPNMGQLIAPQPLAGFQFQGLNPGLADQPDWLAGQAVSTVVSPDGKTLLILTSGYNRVYNLKASTPPYPWYGPDSNEYVFVFDISTPTPQQTQVLQVRDSYHGIVFDPSGAAFYVAGGTDDVVHIFTLSGGSWVEALRSSSAGEPAWPLALGHNNLGIGLNLSPNGLIAVNSQVGVYPCAAGLAISKDGQTLVVANYYNDSVTVFTGGLGHWTMAPGPNPSIPGLDLRPGKNDPTMAGVPGGEYPFWVVVKGAGAGATAYISSIRDREIVVVNLGATLSVAARIHVTGQPNRMTLNAAQTLLYVAEDQSDTVDVIDTTANVILETIPVVAPLLPSSVAQFTGANPNSVTLSPDETQLWVTDGNLNCISVVALSGTNIGDQVVGLIPTGWYPNSVSFNSPGSGAAGSAPVYAYVVNMKSPTDANPLFCYGGYGPPNSPNCNPSNQYNPQRTRAGFQSFPVPNSAQLATLTAQVAINNHFASVESANDLAVMAAVRQAVQHVIFIIKENRTYDQVLGDLPVGNGDPTLVEFGAAITPNQHNLAAAFVTLDNFLCTAEVSYDGWLWTTTAQAPDVVEHQYPVTYAYRGLSLDSEGTNRNVNVGIPAAPAGSVQANVAARQAADPFTSSDPDVLPGQVDVASPDGPDHALNQGHLWDAAMRTCAPVQPVPPPPGGCTHLTVRNYGFFIDGTLYGTTAYTIPVARYPFLTGTIVAHPTSAALNPFTDPYFRGFDNSLPDFYRYQEWARDFDARYAGGHHAGRMLTAPPSLTLVRFMHDHTGNYSTAIDGVNTPDLEVADNDYAVGLLVQKIANSPYADNTLIFVVEDDAQDGGDHVDSHRTTAYVAGAYVKQGALVTTAYTTLNLLRTIEEVLGIPPMNLNDALAAPMADIFNQADLFTNKKPSPWTFAAAPSALLYNTSLPLPPQPTGMVVPKPAHDAKYWARVTKGMDFTDADRVDSEDFNRILWSGLMGNRPYPVRPSGIDLRQNRAELLAHYRRSLKQKAPRESKRGTAPAARKATD